MTSELVDTTTEIERTARRAAENLVIVGGGVAAFSAAVYAARSGLRPLVVASALPGGDLATTTEVENYPGFSEGIDGPELVESMQAQAERFGASVLYESASEVDLARPLKTVVIDGSYNVHARAVIIATGSAYRHLNVAGEEELTGHGVSWCATCDGFFYRGQDVAVVGGGDSAAEEALYLTGHASKVTILVRGDRMRASRILRERVAAHEGIEVLLGTRVDSILGDTSVTGVAVHRQDGPALMDTSAVFIAVGSDPRSHLIHGLLETTPTGHIVVDGRSSRTSAPGVFAAGDVIDPRYRQAVVAAASGAVAAMDAEEYLAALD